MLGWDAEEQTSHSSFPLNITKWDISALSASLACLRKKSIRSAFILAFADRFWQSILWEDSTTFGEYTQNCHCVIPWGHNFTLMGLLTDEAGRCRQTCSMKIATHILAYWEPGCFSLGFSQKIWCWHCNHKNSNNFAKTSKFTQPGQGV